MDLGNAALDVDEDTVVGLIQHFVAFGLQGELKGDLSLPSWDLPCFGHLHVTADQRDGLQNGTGRSLKGISRHDFLSIVNIWTPNIFKNGSVRFKVKFSVFF